MLSVRSALTISAGSLLLLAAPVGEAAAATCYIPRVVLCEGCVKDLRITIAKDGSCHIGFDGSQPTAIGTDGSAVKISVEAPEQRLERTSRTTRTRPQSRDYRRPACFEAYGRTYCE